MICPYCRNENTKVLESRMSSERTSIRRRRECENCRERFTTYERIEANPIIVIKKNKTKEEYSREKIIKSMEKAFCKKQAESSIFQEIAARVEFEISLLNKKEISSNYIGEKVLGYLKPVDELAYFRYLSTFKNFDSLEDLYRKEYKLEQEELSFL